VDSDNVCKGRTHVHGSEMRQPFGLFSTTFHDIPGPRPNSMTFQVWKIWILNSMTFQDLYAPCLLNTKLPEMYAEWQRSPILLTPISPLIHNRHHAVCQPWVEPEPAKLVTCCRNRLMSRCSSEHRRRILVLMDWMLVTNCQQVYNQ